MIQDLQGDNRIKKTALAATIVFVAQVVFAGDNSEISAYQSCLLTKMDLLGEEVTIGELRKDCVAETKSDDGYQVVAVTPSYETESSAIDEMLAREREGVFNPFALTPHKPTFIAASLMDEANQDPYATAEHPAPVEDYEMVFQVSFKAPVWRGAFGGSGDLWVGYTAKSWWQLFNKEFSSPFRETNYNPEIFWQTRSDVSLFGWDLDAYRLGFEHQSNGRNVPLSRSWNRVYAEFGFSKDDWTIALRPWYRLPEDSKESPGATKGDDNPDIWRYMGYGEYTLIYRAPHDHLWTLMTRYNFHSDPKGAAQLTWTFPLSDHFRGYVELFSGYGDSMIDYNESIARLSLGIALTDTL